MSGRMTAKTVWLIAAAMAAAIFVPELPATGQSRGNPPQPAQALPGIVRHDRVGPGCAPVNTSAGCAARRATIQPVASASAPLALRPKEYGVVEPRFVPPQIVAFLHDPRLDPQTRTFLEVVAGKPTKDWTLNELSMVEQVVPTLTEMHIATAELSDFYEFLGLDPTQLFEPQLGNWQSHGTAFDAKNYDATQQAQCLHLLGIGENPDPSNTTLGDLASCSPDTANGG